jgi:toxin ParE1/3/4
MPDAGLVSAEVPRSITLAESAIRDFEAVRDWCASQSAPRVDDRLIRESLSSVYQLVDFPESGRVVPEFDQPWLRELVRPPFRIVYRLDASGDRIRIVRIWRSERLMDKPEFTDSGDASEPA